MQTDDAEGEPDHGLELPQSPTSATKRLWRPAAEILVLLGMVYVALTFAVDSVTISDESMRPNLLNGQRVLVNRMAYRLTPPQRGDVIAVRNANDGGSLVARRVVGLPGEELEIIGNQVLVNGQTLVELYLDPSSLQTLVGERQSTRRQYRLNEGEYFLMSDKRTIGIDSRDWGAIKPDRIEGRLGVILWPPDAINLTKHVRYEEQVLK